MSPMDELQYFQLPTYNQVVVPGNSTDVELVKADPLRVYFALSANSSNGQFYRPDVGTAGTLIPIVTSQALAEFYHSDKPGLPQQRWIANNTTVAAVTFVTLECKLLKWPSESDNALRGSINDLSQQVKRLSSLIARLLNDDRQQSRIRSVSGNY